MPVVWMKPGPAVSWQDYSELARVLGWRDGEPFHPSESDSSETAYVAPDGTRIALYHPKGGVSWGGERRIAVYGPHAEHTADAIARRIPTSDRSVEGVFHRFDPVNTAVCATDDGAWWIQSRLQTVAFQGRDDTMPTAVATVYSPVAIAAGERSIYVTSCDDPRASLLGRIDRETRVLEWLCQLDRPAQLAVIGDIAYIAVASGLVAVDHTGAVESRALDVPPPNLVTRHRDALYWIDPSGNHVVEYRAGRGRVIATGAGLTALDVDDDGLYLLEGNDRLLAIENGHTRRFELDPWLNGRAGVVRLGPFLVTLAEHDDSYQTRVRREWVPRGYPQLAAAPHALLAQAVEDEHSREVLADWLGERGVRVSTYGLQRMLTESDYGDHDWPSASGSLPCALAAPLATFDRETGYSASGRHLTVFRVDDLF